MGEGLVNYIDKARMVDRAVEGGYGLYVELDEGAFDLFGSELLETFDDLAPGESFEIRGVVLP